MLSLKSETGPYRLSLVGFLAAACVLLAIPQECQAQVLYGSFSGIVRDPTGGAVPGADVSIINEATNYTQAAVSNEVGAFTLPNVPVGAYVLRVSLPGFKEYVAEGVAVTVGTVTRENVTLQVGEITEAITVSAAATTLQTDTTDVRGSTWKARRSPTCPWRPTGTTRA